MKKILFLIICILTTISIANANAIDFGACHEINIVPTYQGKNYFIGENGRYVTVKYEISPKSTCFNEGNTFKYLEYIKSQDTYTTQGMEVLSTSVNNSSINFRLIQKDVFTISVTYKVTDSTKVGDTVSLGLKKLIYKQNGTESSKDLSAVTYTKLKKGNIDLDTNNIVGTYDLIKYIRYLIDEDKITREQYEYYDLNNDKKVNNNDLLIIIRSLVNLDTSSFCPEKSSGVVLKLYNNINDASDVTEIKFDAKDNFYVDEIADPIHYGKVFNGWYYDTDYKNAVPKDATLSDFIETARQTKSGCPNGLNTINLYAKYDEKAAGVFYTILYGTDNNEFYTEGALFVDNNYTNEITKIEYMNNQNKFVELSKTNGNYSFSNSEEYSAYKYIILDVDDLLLSKNSQIRITASENGTNKTITVNPTVENIDEI